MAKSINWVCEYRNCNTIFKRYDCYVKKGIKRFCCQSHSALEYNSNLKDIGLKKSNNYIAKERKCIYCENNTFKKTSVCNECRSILNNLKFNRRHNPNLDKNFTPREYWNLLKEQNYECKICGVKKCSTGNRMVMDHDHATGKIRGLLCLSCNVKLGWFENRRNKIESYLSKTTGCELVIQTELISPSP